MITDCTVLDKQLQDTIFHFKDAQGLVKCITHDIGNQSKSKQLAEPTRIIIVIIQTFSALFDALEKYAKPASGRYPVIAAEAQSSTTGSSASKLKQILGNDAPEAEEVSAEELLDDGLAARAPSERISYSAFLFAQPQLMLCSLSQAIVGQLQLTHVHVVLFEATHARQGVQVLGVYAQLLQLPIFIGRDLREEPVQPDKAM